MSGTRIRARIVSLIVVACVVFSASPHAQKPALAELKKEAVMATPIAHKGVTAGGKVQAMTAEYRDRMRNYYFDPTKYKTYLEQLGITYPTLRSAPSAAPTPERPLQ